MTKRLVLAGMVCLSMLGQGQTGPANIANTLYASNFAQWTVAQGNNGPFSWSSSAVCTSANSGGVAFKPFVVGSPIRIVDTAAPANSETVTVTAVNIIGSGCSIATTTPANRHYSFYLGTATGGLQEAINYSIQNLGVGAPASVVLTTPAWSRLGGTTPMIVNAQGVTTVSIMDERTSVFTPYTWNGSVYVAQPLASSGVQSFNTRTGFVTLESSDVDTALGPLTGCSTVGYVYSPQSNTCIQAGTPATVTSVTATSPLTATPTGTVVNVASTGLTGTYNPAGLQITVIDGIVQSIGSPYSITGYTCSLTTSTGGGGSACGNYEIGTTGSNPSFTGITYSVTGTNGGSFTDSASHTGTFSSPWTSAAITATYGTGTQISFTLNATNSTATPTSASVSNDFNPTLYCIFAGAGGSSGTGATSSGSGTCTAGETATITGASVTTILPSVRLGAAYAGETFVITLSGQNAVLLLDGGCGHSLTVNTTPTTFNTHTATLTNILGGSQTGMCVYTSPSTGTGTFTIGIGSL